MKNISNKFKKIIKAGGPFYAYAKCTLTNGTELTLDSESDFYANGNSFSESGGSGFPLGVALSKQITITLDNSDERYSKYDFFGAKIVLYTEADLSNGTQERILEGTFTVIDSIAPGDALEINACDNMYKLDADFTSSLSYPTTLQQLWNELCDYYDLGNGSPTFLNSNYVVQSKPEAVTGREMAGYIAQIAAGNAYINYNGQLCIKSYDFSPFDDFPIVSGRGITENVPDTISAGSFGDGLSDTLSGGEFGEDPGYYILSDFTTAPDIATDDVTITGITTAVEDDGSGEETTLIYGTDDYALKIDNPLILGNEEQAITAIGQVLCGVTVRPFSGDFFPVPSLEFMDLVIVIDRKDNIYPSFITDHAFAYLGGSSISNGLESPEKNASSYSSNATQVYKKVHQQLVKQQTAFETAMEQLSQQVANASGLYTTKETQSDGSTIYYMHNKPTLVESDIVWKMTAETLTVSTDGGKSWNAGITVNGEVIAKIMSTIGIHFEWGVYGTLDGKYLKANSVTSEQIKIENTESTGEKGIKIILQNSSYTLLFNNKPISFFGYKEMNDSGDVYVLPKLVMGGNGYAANDDYFGIVPYLGNSDNPQHTDNAYVDIYYHETTHNDSSNFKMYDTGDIRISPVKDLEITTNYAKAAYESDVENRLALFTTSDDSAYNSNLQIGAIANHSNSNGLVLADRHADQPWENGSYSGPATMIRIQTDSNGDKFVRPLDGYGDIGLGSTNFPFKNVVTAAGTLSASGIYANQIQTMSVSEPVTADSILDRINVFERPSTYSMSNNESNSAGLILDVSQIINTGYVTQDGDRTYINETEIIKLLIMEIKNLKNQIKGN